jgi:hypothetical protein
MIEYDIERASARLAFHKRLDFSNRVGLKMCWSGGDMQTFIGWRTTVLGMLLAGVAATPALADRVSGTLTRTFVIVEDTDVIGDITCDVPNGTACFSFGAPDVELRLNGFSLTGRADAATGCGGLATNGEAGITTNNMSRVTVRGPGLVQRFRGDGITVAGSTGARVENLTMSTNCMSGVRILATSFGTLVERTLTVRNGSTAAGFICGGI